MVFAKLSTLAAALLLSLSTVASAADFSWDGSWKGTAGTGRVTVITIAKGKVVSWVSNGQTAKIAAASVGKGGVSITHAEGAKVVMTPRPDGTVQYRWSGKGATSSAIMKKI